MLAIFAQRTDLPYVQQRDLRDTPAIIRARYLELNHRDRIRRTAHNTQAATDTLLLVDNHISTPPPGLSSSMHRIAFDYAGETFHADAVIGADVHAARTQDADGGVNHDV